MAVLSEPLAIEGGLLSHDLLERIEEQNGQKTVGDLRKPLEEIQRREVRERRLRRMIEQLREVPDTFPLPDYAAILWSYARELYREFREVEPKDTTATRERWVVRLLRLLDYDPVLQRQAIRVGNKSYFISHRAEGLTESPPVHIVGWDQELGERPTSGRGEKSPHSLVQEYLNDTDDVWGIVTNGRRFRILRTSTYFTRPSYIEFDLESIFEHEHFDAFVLFVRLAHRSRLPIPGKGPENCLLEQYFVQSKQEGNRARDRLRDSVKSAIEVLGEGLIVHPANEELRRRLSDGSYSLDQFYRDLLYLIYRLMFLFCAEERGLLSTVDPSSNGHTTRRWLLYQGNLAASRLRTLAESVELEGQHHYDDLWLGLQTLFRILSDADLARQFMLSPLDGELFACDLLLDRCRVRNSVLLRAVRHLSQFEPEEEGVPRRINYARMDVEELGSVYESLLDYRPAVDLTMSPPFWLDEGTERKSTGSYYTPDELVRELIRSALEPVLEERLKEVGWDGTRGDAEKAREAILSLRAVDPACGSGHFLLAAARRLGQELARVETGQREPDAAQVRKATREVIRHCIYGVDKNPLAVDLCRVALWIEGHKTGMPLTFLDHHIKCGDSLVGVFDLKVLKQGIPDDAFKPITGDDTDLAKELKKRNARQRKELAEQGGRLLRFEPDTDAEQLSQSFGELEALADDSPHQVREKRQRYEAIVGSPEAQRLKRASDLWTAAFFQPRDPATPREAFITTELLYAYLDGQRISEQALHAADELARRFGFFHWPLEFPSVFTRGRFDVVLGNPPWERIKLSEQEFFRTRDPRIAEAPNKAARGKLIRQLQARNPELWKEYNSALRAAEALSRYLRLSEDYPLTGRGDINTYSVFAERMWRLLNRRGRAGLIVPTGIATDHTNKSFFGTLLERGSIVSLYDLENREGIFPHVHRSYKFSLLTLSGDDAQGAGATDEIRVAFFCTRAEQLRDERRVFSLTPEDIALMNPNTQTLPVFRTRQDAELTRAIYRRVPVLVDERTGANPWKVRFFAMLHMTNDSYLFRTRGELQREGYRPLGNRFKRGREIWLPLYEAKMIWLYDHRFGTYEGVGSRSSTHLPKPGEQEHANADFLVQPWYWVAEEEVRRRLEEWPHRWMMGWRDIARSTDERTAVFSAVPYAAVGNNTPLLLSLITLAPLQLCLLANCAALVLDYVVRQKTSNQHMNFFTVRQLPLIPPSAYREAEMAFLGPYVLELVYTAWDIKPLADDVWQDADDDLRAAIRRQWEENKQETGGHEWRMPPWISAYPDIETDPGKGIPFPPFKWSEERRARIQAELDAYYALLYGLTRKQLRYILDPADLTEKELEDILDPYEEVEDPLDEEGYRRRCEQSTFPGETFRVLKEKELSQFGEYRTRRLVLEAYERLKDRFVGRTTEYRHLVKPDKATDQPAPAGRAGRRRGRSGEKASGGPELDFGDETEDSEADHGGNQRAADRTGSGAGTSAGTGPYTAEPIVHPDQLVPVVRRVMSRRPRDLPISGDDIVEAVCDELGLAPQDCRFGGQALRRAVRRRIVVREGDQYYGWCLTIGDFEKYQYDCLVAAVYTAIRNGHGYKRDIIRGAAAWLGFERVGPNIAFVLEGALKRLVKLRCVEFVGVKYRVVRELPPVPYSKSELMVEIRKLAWADSPDGELSREEFIDVLGERLGVVRRSREQQVALHRAVMTAARRKIIEQDQYRCIHLLTRGIEDYKSNHYEWLVEFLVGRVGQRAWEQQELFQRVARGLGFARTGSAIEEVLKGVLRAAIRRKLLYRDESNRIRRM